MLLDGQRMKIKKGFDCSREKILSLLFPPRCPICDEILTPEENEKGIHLACENKLYPVTGAVCMHCGRPLGQEIPKKQTSNIHFPTTYAERGKTLPEHMKIENVYEYCRECRCRGYAVNRNICKNNDRTSNSSAITQAKSLYLYKGAIKKSMYRFKYANKREYARFFARQAVEKYGEWLGISREIDESIDNGGIITSIKNKHAPQVIVPVPMYEKKKKQRGYNQAESFAEELSRLTGIPVDKNCVIRIKDTTPQKELSEVERKNNLENAFQKGKNIVQCSHILVVDDIYTTGYTAEAVARELRKQGGCHIYVLSICIGGDN